ncbi:MAG: hypothetical protein GY765_25295 [bacterium]|nr:hypothetical protein [bacterium]
MPKKVPVESLDYHDLMILKTKLFFNCFPNILIFYVTFEWDVAFKGSSGQGAKCRMEQGKMGTDRGQAKKLKVFLVARVYLDGDGKNVQSGV